MAVVAGRRRDVVETVQVGLAAGPQPRLTDLRGNDRGVVQPDQGVFLGRSVDPFHLVLHVGPARAIAERRRLEVAIGFAFRTARQAFDPRVVHQPGRRGRIGQIDVHDLNRDRQSGARVVVGRVRRPLTVGIHAERHVVGGPRFFSAESQLFRVCDHPLVDRIRVGLQLGRIRVVPDRRHRHEFAVQVDDHRRAILVRIGVQVFEEQLQRRLLRHVVELRRNRVAIPLGGFDRELARLDRLDPRVVQSAGHRLAHRVVVEVRERVRERVGIGVEATALGPIEVQARLHHVRHVVVGRRAPGRHTARIHVDPRYRSIRIRRVVDVRPVEPVPAEARLGDPVRAELQPRIAALEVGDRRFDERHDRLHEHPPPGDVLDRQQVDVEHLRRREPGSHRVDHRRERRHRLLLPFRVALEDLDGDVADVAVVQTVERFDRNLPPPDPFTVPAHVAGQRVIGCEPSTAVVHGDRQRRLWRHAVIERIEIDGRADLPTIDEALDLGEDRLRLGEGEHPILLRVGRGVVVGQVVGQDHRTDDQDDETDRQLDERVAALARPCLSIQMPHDHSRS